jgi:L-fucose isomerase-like protein
VGVAFTQHLALSRKPGAYVISSMEWQGVEEGLQMVKAKRMFEETRVLHIRSNITQETVMERLGMKVKAIPRNSFTELYVKMPAGEEVKDIASTMRKGAKKIVEPTDEDLLNSARAYTTAKRLMSEHQSNALSMDCLGMVTDKLVPTPPCGAWSILQDEGITAGCEADLMGAASLMLSSYLLNRPGFMNDPVPETYKNTLIAAHCVSGTRLEGFEKSQAPYILRDHAESSLGVSVQVIWPVGQPVTLIDFSNPDEMFLDTGTVVSNIDTPPAGGCRTQVEIKMDNIEDSRDVKGFHQVVVLGNHRRIIEGFSQLYGIKVIHSPQFGQHWGA